MKVITFSALLFIHLTCFGQCKIDKKHIKSFYEGFKQYSVCNIGKHFEGFCYVDNCTDYIYLDKNPNLIPSAEDEIFYDVLHNAQGDKQKIINRLVSNNIDSSIAFVLADYMECKHFSKYQKWKEGERKWYLERDKNGVARVSKEIWLVPEIKPIFPGGTEGLKNYLEKNIQYPYPALISKTEGKVFVQFVIDYDGIIKGAYIVKGIGYGCDEEALRIVNSMPKWKPGKQYGENVSVRYSIPVVFKLP